MDPVTDLPTVRTMFERSHRIAASYCATLADCIDVVMADLAHVDPCPCVLLRRASSRQARI